MTLSANKLKEEAPADLKNSPEEYKKSVITRSGGAPPPNYAELTNFCIEPCKCDDKSSQLVSYRSIDFKIKDMIDMRSLIH